MYEDNLAANRIPLLYPGQIYPGGPAHPSVGLPVPNGGQRDIEKYAMALRTICCHVGKQLQAKR